MERVHGVDACHTGYPRLANLTVDQLVVCRQESGVFIRSIHIMCSTCRSRVKQQDAESNCESIDFRLKAAFGAGLQSCPGYPYLSIYPDLLTATLCLISI
jgi:hypothetical protein